MADRRRIAAAFIALADAARELGSAFAAEDEAEVYDREHLPPGAASWRAVLDAGRRGDLEVTRIGRNAVVTREAWAAFTAAKKTKRGVIVRDSDREALARMGVRLAS